MRPLKPKPETVKLVKDDLKILVKKGSLQAAFWQNQGYIEEVLSDSGASAEVEQGKPKRRGRKKKTAETES